MEKNTQSEQVRRIIKMQSAYDRSAAAVEKLSKALERYEKLRPELEQLIQYYDSGAWRQDYEDDNDGKIPQELNRGILSEDAIFDLIGDVEELKKQLRKAGRK